MKAGMILVGLALVAVGCFWHYPPLSLCVVGAVLFVGGVASHFANNRGVKKE